jgi:predicted branched-subunit amino acid permease
MIALAIVNPVYFLCMMIGAMKNIKTTIAIVIGIILGPLFYLSIPEWSILIAGFIGGNVAFLMKGRSNDI